MMRWSQFQVKFAIKQGDQMVGNNSPNFWKKVAKTVAKQKIYTKAPFESTNHYIKTLLKS